MSPYTQATAARYRESQRLLHALADGLSEDAFNWKPDAKAWSVGECIVHLNTMAKGYLPVLEAAVDRDAPRGEGPFHYGFVARRFIAAVTPGSRPIPTAGAMRPPAVSGTRSAIDKGWALASFDGYTDRLVAAVERSDGLDLGAVRAASPFLRVLRLPVGAFFEALGHHALRHVAQAGRVTERPGFPG